MEILIGAILFPAGVAALAYAPGKLALHFLRCPLSRLEDTALSCLVGLIASCAVHAGFALLGAPALFPLWPLATAVVFLVTYRGRMGGIRTLLRRLPSGPVRAQHAALAAVFLGGVAVFATLPSYFRNLTWKPDGSMRAVSLDDAVFHLSMANELTHSFPPQTPFFSGYPLSYHVGSDLVVAMFANGTGIPTRDLSLRFVPVLFLGLSILAVFCFSRRWLGSGPFAALATALVFFGEDFSFIPGLLLGEKSDWSIVYFQVPSVLSLFFHNPMLPAVGMLFAGLFSLQSYLRDRRFAWLFVTALLFSGLIEVKVFSAIQALGSLGVAGLVSLALFRDSRLWKASVVSVALALPLVLVVILGNRHGARFDFEARPSPYVPQAMAALGLREIPAGVLGYALLALPVYLLGSLGLRVIGIPATFGALLRPRNDGGLRLLLAVFVVAGIAATLTLRVGPEAYGSSVYNNSVWFFAGSKHVSWIFAVEFLQRCHARLVARHWAPGWTAAGLALGSLALALPSSVQNFAWCARTFAVPVAFGREAAEAAQFVGRSARPGDVVLCEPGMVYPVLSLTRCRIPYWVFASYTVPRDVFLSRQAGQQAFWEDWAKGRVDLDTLRDFHVGFVLASLGSASVPATLPPGLVPVYSNQGCVVLKLEPASGAGAPP